MADFYARAPAGLTRDQLAAQLAARVAAAALPGNVLRVVIVLCRARKSASSTRSVSATRAATVEDAPLRGLHPEMAERLGCWRLSEFELERLPSAEDVYLMRGTRAEPVRRAPIRRRRGARPHARPRR